MLPVWVDVGAKNERRLCAVNYNKTPGFEVVYLHAFVIVVVRKSKVGWYVVLFCLSFTVALRLRLLYVLLCTT